MNDAIKPALTPEEWASYPNWPTRVGGLDDERPLYFPTRHGIAAANLHGQPFGFTRDDVGVLRECAKQQRDIDGDPEATAYAGSLQYGDELDSLADHIAALLPPEAR